MRKFKHKNTGRIAELSSHGGDYNITPNNEIEGCFPKWLIENSNDWEEIKEFPKIISFRKTREPMAGAIAKLHLNGYYSTNSATTDKFTLSDFLYGKVSVEDGTFEIYQVQTSPTEIFTIGDKVKHPFAERFDVISKFMICNDPKKDVVGAIDNPDLIGKLVANVGNCFGNCNIEVSKLKKAPEPLFVTEDGVGKYFGDDYYYVVEGDVRILPVAWVSLSQKVDWKCAKKVPLGRKQFHSLKTCEEYIKQNKPKFSVKDIEEALLFAKEEKHSIIEDEGFIILSKFNEKKFKEKLGI